MPRLAGRILHDAGLRKLPGPLRGRRMRRTVRFGCRTDYLFPLLGPPPSGIFDHIAIAEDHGCGVTTTGVTQCRGNDTMGQSTIPAHYP